MKFTKIGTLLLAAALAGCAQSPQPPKSAATLSSADAQARYQQGLTAYRENRFEPALGDFNAALASGRLKQDETINARKHIAFIHCSSGRELPCREQFQAILAADPAFELSANEANHPQWGPVWRSLKGAAEEKIAVSRAASVTATPGQQKLAEGIKEYDAGRYKESLDAFQAALKAGLSEKADEIRGHKYAAFVYCITQRTKQCRTEFQYIFKLDPAFELLPSEVGHPAWASVYRSEKQLAAKQAAAQQG